MKSIKIIIIKGILLFYPFFSIAQNPFCISTDFGGSTLSSINSINPVISIGGPDNGEAPFFVHVSAKLTTASGTSSPYQDLEYSWDFGDSGSGFLFSNPITLQTIHPNSDQEGPEATYIYENPGSYSITLYARGWTGTGYIVSASSITIEVSAWTGQDRYFDPDGGNDANDGLSPGSAWQSWNQLNTWITGGNNRQALIKRGTYMLVNNPLYTDEQGVRLGAFGTGSKPVLLADTSMTDKAIIYLTANSNDVIADHIYHDLVFDGNGNDLGQSFFAYSGGNGAVMENILMYDCDLVNGGVSGQTVIYTGGGHKDNIAFWNCNFDSQDGLGNTMYTQDIDYFSITGGSFKGGRGSILLHYIYPNKINNSSYRWIDFQEAGQGKSFCINHNTVNDGTHTSYVLVDGCNISGTINGIDFSNSNNTSSEGEFRDAVIQKNAFHDLGKGSQGLGVFGYCIGSMTLRDNVFYNNELQDIRVEDPEAMMTIYRNIFYQSSILGTGGLDIESGSSGQIHNNIFNYESASGNIISLGLNSNWIIDGNQYWSPGNPTFFWDMDSSTGFDFTAWQMAGFDLAGWVANPDFPDPDNGVFCEPTTTVQSIPMEDNIVVRPNPAQGKITIFGMEEEIDELIVYNITGQSVMMNFTNVNELDISTLPEGLYFIMLKIKNHISTIKIVKQ